MKPKLGFISIAHKDYVSLTSRKFASEAINNIKESGIGVIHNDEAITDIITAQKVAKKMAKEDIDGVVIFLETWIECSTGFAAIRMIEHFPFFIWGFPMFINEKGQKDQTGSLVSYAVLKGSLDRARYNYKGILSNVDDQKNKKDILSFARAAYTYRKLKEARVGLVGYASMSMYPGTFDHLFLRTKIGPEVLQFDSYELINEINIISEEECENVINIIKTKAKVSKFVKEEQLIKASKMYIALKKMIMKYGLEAITLKCQYELSQMFGMTGCIPLSLLADENVVTGCEGDMPTLISMLIFKYLTNQVINYADILDFSKNSVGLFSSCGFAPFSLAADKKESVIKNFTEMSSVMVQDNKEVEFDAFKGIVNSCTFKSGEVTFGRIIEDIGSYKFLLGTGKAIETELRQGIMPAMNIKLDCSVDNFKNNFPSQHYAICYGNISNEVEELCRIMNVQFLKL